MLEICKADVDFINYLKKEGFIKCLYPGLKGVQYLTNLKTGIQVAINSFKKQIRFITKKGNTISKHSQLDIKEVKHIING